MAVLAAVLLLLGIGLLGYSFLTMGGRPANVSAGPSPTVTLSPLIETRTGAASPSPGGSPLPPVVIVITTYVAVPTFVPMPSGQTESSDLLAVISTVGGLVASIAGIASAVVSMRGARPR